MAYNNHPFEYTYSAPRQEEIKRIREKYLPKEEDKMAQLRRLDNGVTQKATVVSLATGIISALVLGVGMCCCLVWNRFIIGILIGVIGIAGVAAAYPIYTRVTARERSKIAPVILRLTDELIK